MSSASSSSAPSSSTSTQPQQDSNNNNNKTVTGYPAPLPHIAAGYPVQVSPPTFRSPRPPQPPPPPTYAHGTLFGLNLLWRLILCLMLLFLIMGLTILITWIILRPRLPEFRVDSGSVSKLSATRSELSANWVFTVLVTNPNTKLSIVYDQVEATVSYGNAEIAVTRLPPFYQEKNNVTSLRVELSVLNGYVGEDSVNSIGEEMAKRSVGFGLNVIALVRLNSGFWRMRENLLRVYCDDVRLEFSGSNSTAGSLSGGKAGSRECVVFL